MSIKSAIKSLQENKLDLMKENFNTALSKKAAEKLEEMKVDIASSYFKK
jgi:hypothetical protein